MPRYQPPPNIQVTTENRLANETSPYLLQHKDNPVAWWPWGQQALDEAQRSGKPILLSVGYAACHWCHVMAHESFEDTDTAAVMNELFVNIKVDREERPDIDQIYMAALHSLGEQGGWPLTMFLTPAGEPVWGGTYFPKTSRYGRPAFVDVLREVARLFREEPDKIRQNRDALMARLSARARPAGQVVIGTHELDQIARQLAGAFDPIHGGLRGAPKFPNAAIYELVWRAGIRTGENHFFNLILFTLRHICEGGIYDHLGGGFSRYSVDERWLVPHFEKMLYDNAQLLELLALAHCHTGDPLYRQRATETVAWLTREMTTAGGAFAASLDADSDGEEGKFYVWTMAEIQEALGPDAADFAVQYDVTPDGNFENNNILNRLNNLPRSMDDFTALHAKHQNSEGATDRLSMLRGKLLILRDNRARPGLDDKVLADWNGLMISALVNAGILLGQPSWLALARRAFDFISGAMTQDERLGHSYRAGKLLLPGLGSDYAAMIRAALALFEATGDRALLDRALAWQRHFDSHYTDKTTGVYYLTADDAGDLIVRPHSTADDAIPNFNAVAAGNLVRLATFTGEHIWRERADQLIQHILSANAQNLFGHAALLNALDLRLRAAEIVCTGPATENFAQKALKLPYLDRIVLRAASATALPTDHPAQEKLKALPGSAAFVCVGESCSLPVHDADQIAAAVENMR
jgi:uncharacterized protein YyaL (SSP411 family)